MQRMHLSLIAATFVGTATAAAPAPAPTTSPKAVACPYSAAEVAAALGMKVKVGAPSEMPFPGGVEYSCAYEQVDGFMTLWVSQSVMSAADQKQGDAYYQRSLAGKTTAIAGDPDGARWQLDPYDPKNVALHYTRGTHRVAIRATAGLKAAEMQPKLLKLRRLP